MTDSADSATIEHPRVIDRSGSEPMRHLPSRPARRASLAPLLGAALALGACGDDGPDDSVPVGGGAGDAAENAAILGDYAATWDLTGRVPDSSAQEIYLVISDPDAGGESEATLHEFFADGNCYETPVGGRGEVTVDPFGSGVFMNELFLFEEALLSLPGAGTLRIEHGPNGARVTTEAQRNDGLVDFEPRC